MKLAVALFIGSAIAVSAARGAELPSRNAPPPATAKTCTVDGAPGFVLPGGDTCVRISGSLTAQVSAGSASKPRANGDP